MARAELVLALCLTCASAAGRAAPAPAPALPAVLTSPAAITASAQRGAVLALARAGTRLVSAGERGTILLSDDNGRHWRQALVPVQTALTALQFVDARRGWAVGHAGVVLRTEDGGERWTLQLDGVRIAQHAVEAATTAGARQEAEQLVQDGPDKPLLALYFSDADNGLVVGAYNLALRTRDGGRSWRYVGHELPNPKRLHLYGIAVHHREMVVAGEQGLLMLSDDGGQGFRALKPPYSGSYFGVLAGPSGSLLAYGLRGTALWSDNGGQRWERAEVPASSALSAGMTLMDGRLLLAGQGGELLLSADQGRSFSRLPGPPAPLASLAQAADGSLVLGTLRGPLVLPLPR